MPAPYMPLALANRFIQLSGETGVSHMKLQKLVYCAHGWWLSVNAPDQIVDEKPQVWRHGPVFPSLYKRLNGFGSVEIGTVQAEGPVGRPPLIDQNDTLAFELLDFVWGRYGRYTAFELSDLTHKKGTPWQIMVERHDYRVPMHLDIPDELVISEFRRIGIKENILSA